MWLSRHNHSKGKDEEITGMNINVTETCTGMMECLTAEEIKHATQGDDHLNALKVYSINDWPSTTAEAKEEIQLYCPFHDDMAVNDGIMKCR